MSYLYIASCCKRGGIYKYAFDGNEYIEQSHCVMDSPTYMIADGDGIHVLLRSPFESEESGYVRYGVGANGDLIHPTQTLSTKGKVACHLYTEEETVYCVNYLSGSVIKLPDTLVVHKGKGQSHTHYIGATPDKKYLCVTDLGLDGIFLYNKTLRLKQRVDMPKGCGVRHLVATEDGYIFTANELNATVSVLKYEKGSLQLLDTVSCIPKQTKGFTAPSAIRTYQDKIYVGVRGSNLISCLSFTDGKLDYQNAFPCGGETPRDFCFDENRLICCNQDSATATVFEERKGEFQKIQTIAIEKPMCVLTK